MANKEVYKPEIEKGAVTFLDVLGWKGKWRDSYEAVSTLKNLINNTKIEAEKIHNDVVNLWSTNPKYVKEMRGGQTDILSISDTIVLFTKGPAIPSLLVHGRICENLIPASIKSNIPLRGASAYGEYSREGNIMIGPAIDEAASWHEATNWIGVNMTPSAMFEIKGDIPKPWGEYSHIPFKKKVNSMNICVEWNLPIDDAIKYFKDMGPHIPEIAEKYLNTYSFLNREKK